MDPFEALVMVSEIYPPSFVQTFGVESEHWFPASWYSRELSLRHDMVCTLLANLEPTSNIREEMGKARGGEPSPKKSKPSQSQPSTSSSSTSSQAGTSGGRSAEYSSDSSDDESNPVRPGERMYRILLLEGDPSISLLQNHLGDEWGCAHPDSYWDLADRKLKKFIEVKVTTDLNEAQELFMKKAVNIPLNSALVWLHPATGQIEWQRHPGGLRGEAKATTFLARRRLLLEQYNALETEMLECKNIQDTIFCCAWFNNMAEEWSNAIWDLRNEPPPPGFNAREGDDLKLIKLDQLPNLLEDPRKREGAPVVKWRGKITPDPFVKNFKTIDENDNEIVDFFFRRIGKIPEHYERDVIAAAQAQDLWESKPVETRSTYSLIGEKEYGRDRTRTLEAALGIDMKATVYDYSCEDTKQQEYKTPPVEKYHPWFDEVVERLNTRHELPDLPFIDIQNAENRSQHPMAGVSQDCVDLIMKNYLESWAAIYASKMTNTYSRLGRSYAPPSFSKQAGRANTIIIPIYATMYSPEGTKSRLVSGVLIRGPNHARVPTDRINFLTIETLHPSDGEIISPYVQNGKVILTRKGVPLLIRSNAICRSDPNYLIFVNGASFMACNLAGEILLSRAVDTVRYDLQRGMLEFIQNYGEWLNARVVEGLLMAAIGGAQEEGYFAQMRKLFMIFLNASRGQRAFSWRADDLCRKTNECLINHPLAMYYHVSLLSILSGYDDNVRQFRNLDDMVATRMNFQP